jgi:hypothetical protein
MTTDDDNPVQHKTPENVTGRPCPDGAALNIMGAHFPCQQMDQMTPESTNHKGWAHSNRDAEAIWGEGTSVAPRTTVGRDYHPDSLESAVYMALGTASVAWESMEGTGVFNDALARAAGEDLINYINSNYDKKEHASA